MECKFCKAECQKAGRQRNGTQKHYCKGCIKYQQEDYRYSPYKPITIEMIPKLVRESVSIRGIARILKIALATVIKKIKWIAGKIEKPPLSLNGKAFELDEVRTYIRKKEN